VAERKREEVSFLISIPLDSDAELTETTEPRS
jgi:hypothetical protein